MTYSSTIVLADRYSDPFQLIVSPLPNASCSLTVFQRPYSRLQNLPLIETGSIDGLALSSAWDIVLDILRANNHKPATVKTNKKRCLKLNEESGVRLSLLFKAIASLSDLDHIRSLQQGITAMSDEEAYYWFAKCRNSNGIRALRVLFEVVL